jgi:hypothetical protein
LYFNLNKFILKKKSRVQFISDEQNANYDVSKTSLNKNPVSSFTASTLSQSSEKLNDHNIDNKNYNNSNNTALVNTGGNNYSNNNDKIISNYYGLNFQQQSLIDTKYDDHFRSASYNNPHRATLNPNMRFISAQQQTSSYVYPTRTTQSYSSARPYPYHLQQQQQQQRRPINGSIKTSATLPAISRCLNTSSILKNNNFHR